MKMLGLSLRNRLILAMTTVSLLSVLFIVIGMSGFYLVTAELWMDRLSPELREAVSRMEEGQEVSLDDLVLISSSFGNDWNDHYASAEVYALFFFAVLALILAVGLGYAMARRISRPLEVVSSAARTVAAGDLEARAHLNGGSSREIEQLVLDFNALAIELERADRELSAGAAAIAHELRTPLTVLRGRLQGLYDGVFEYSPQMVQSLIGHVDALSRIVEDMRTLALGSSGQLTIEKEETDLAVLLQDVAETFRPELEAAGMQLELSLAHVSIFVDAGRMRQVVLALLDNARRYAREGEVVILETEESEEQVRIRVIDHGPGIALSNQERMFDRFWRADPSRSRAHGGSGLGLAIVRGIIQAHDGEVSCAPREGGGLIFSLFLPRA